MTRRANALSCALLLLAAACAPEAEEGGMPEMSPAEHAQMQGGGNQGATDTSGAAVRQAVHLTASQERALGVVYSAVTSETLERTVRTVGTERS